MLHLRLIVPVDRADEVVRRLCEDPAVATVTRERAAALRPPGDLVTADIPREIANRIIDMLRDLGVHHDGSITAETTELTLSHAAMRADAVAPGHPTDALVWAEVAAMAREDSAPTPSYLIFMVIAALIAACGILTDSPVLIVGAMILGPEYGPLVGLCVGLVRRRLGAVATSAWTLTLGLTLSAVGTLLLTLVLRATGVLDDGYVFGGTGVVAFVSGPDAFSAIVASAAGIAGMLTITEERMGALVGVLVSVTTIPAAANVGVAAAVGDGDVMVGSLAQLGVNVGCLLVAGTITLVAQRLIWMRVQRTRET